jgi:hypothetical protein
LGIAGIANAVEQIENHVSEQKNEIGRLRQFLVTIMVNCERSPNLTKDDIHDLCVAGLNGKTIQEAFCGTPIPVPARRPDSQDRVGAIEAAYKEGYFAGVRNPDVENVSAMFIHSAAAKAIETRSAKTEGLGPKDESAARQGLPETSLGGSNDR